MFRTGAVLAGWPWSGMRGRRGGRSDAINEATEGWVIVGRVEAAGLALILEDGVLLSYGGLLSRETALSLFG